MDDASPFINILHFLIAVTVGAGSAITILYGLFFNKWPLVIGMLGVCIFLCGFIVRKAAASTAFFAFALGSFQFWTFSLNVPDFGFIPALFSFVLSLIMVAIVALRILTHEKFVLLDV